jgi:acetyl-CoA carboxylase biotin carboxylase subunit
MVTGLDLVALQIRAAAGEKLDLPDTRPWSFRGHAIECRINAENPQDFSPSPGRISEYCAPGGFGVRVDSALYPGYRVPPFYDSLVAKLIVHGDDREECVMRLARALDEYVIGGIETTIPLHQRLAADADFRRGAYDIHWLERFLAGAAT